MQKDPPSVHFWTAQQDVLEFLWYIYPGVWQELMLSAKNGQDDIAIMQFDDMDKVNECMTRFQNKTLKFPTIRSSIIIQLLDYKTFVSKLSLSDPKFEQALLQSDEEGKRYLRVVIGLKSIEDSGKVVFLPYAISRLEQSSETFTYTQTFCNFCFTKRAVAKCGKCLQLQYCSKKCQVLHWNNLHRSLCIH